MEQRPTPLPPGPPPVLQTMGCAALVLALFFMCLMPVFLFDAMRFALEQLHLSPGQALVAVIGILVGGLFNLPLYRIHREDEQAMELTAVYGMYGWMPQWRQMRRETVIAVNVGGCLIPLGISIAQLYHLRTVGGTPWTGVVVASVANIAACYFVARPVNGIGIIMPAFVSPLVAIGTTFLILGAPEMASVRAPVAFVAGVLGPLVGADLLHLKDITRVSTGMLSIGGAGTFDGIVLSGILAALICGLAS